MPAHPPPPPVRNPFWDERFAGEAFKYGTAPNAWLREQAHRLPAQADVLVPGDGEGRNGVWLAQCGHRVLALDSSGVGLTKARGLAASRGLRVHAVADSDAAAASCATAGVRPADAGSGDADPDGRLPGVYATALVDLAHWQPAPESTDAVVLIYTHLPSSQRRALHRRLAAALRPGGWLLLEAFEPRQLALASGGPKDPDMLPTLEALAEDFTAGPVALQPLQAATCRTMLHEGPGHQGEAAVVRWLGRRPARSSTSP